MIRSSRSDLKRVRKVWMLWLALTAAALLSGCKETVVDTTVGRNGTIRRDVILVVPAKDYDAVRSVAENVLGKEWRYYVESDGRAKTLTCERKVNIYRSPDVVLFDKAKLTRKPVFPLCPYSRYQYQDAVDLTDFFVTRTDKAVADSVTVTYRVTMPGRVKPSSVTVQPSTTKPEIINDSTVQWQTLLSTPTSIQAESVAPSWLLLIFEIVMLLWLLKVIGSGIFRLRLRRQAARERRLSEGASAKPARPTRAERQRAKAEQRRRKDEDRRRRRGEVVYTPVEPMSEVETTASPAVTTPEESTPAEPEAPASAPEPVSESACPAVVSVDSAPVDAAQPEEAPADAGEEPQQKPKRRGLFGRWRRKK